MIWSMFQWRSLKTRVTLFTLAIFVISIWSLALYVSRLLRGDIQQLLGEQQFSTVSMLAAGINDEFTLRLNSLETWAAGRMSPKILADNADTQTLLSGSPTIQGMFNGGIFITRLDGISIAAFPYEAERLGVNYMERDFMVAALKEGKATIGRPAVGKVLGVPTFGMAVPIFDAQGKVIGALVGATNLGKHNFLDKITDNRYGRTGDYLLGSPKYRLIITASDKNRIMTSLPAPGIVPALDHFLQGGEGSAVFVNPLGVEILASAKQIPVAGWMLAAILPTEEAFSPIYELRQRILVAAIFLTLLAGGLTWWLLRRQLEPMVAAARTLALMSDTNQPSGPLLVARHDEVGELIGGFNRLLETLGQREKALTESKARYERAVDGANDGIWEWNPRTGENYLSPRWKKLLGYEDHELPNVRESFVNQIHPEDRPQVLEAVRGHLEERKPYEIEFRMRCKSGAYRWFFTRGQGAWDEQGNPLLLAGSTTDITERKQLEAQLRESQKMEALGTLAGGVAHDFNNVLAMILGNVELARQDVGTTHPALESLDEISKASRRAKDLVEQILAFGRRQALARKPTSLSLIVLEAARLIRATLPSMVSLNIECEPDAPAVLADATAIKQILLNLCSNAMHAVQDQARPGVIEIRLEAHTQSEAHGDLRPGQYACLTVRDNGPGMDEETRSRIFEPFFTTKQVGKGTGLGLSVVHGIVKAHEASLELESISGEGSAFRIYFPAVEAPVTEVTAPTSDPAPVSGKGKHVLYVDDEGAIVSLMKRMLERRGYRVSGYTDPEEALAAARANPGHFDLVVTDYNMPGVSGLEVAKALKEIRPDLPVVLASGFITEELRAEAPAAGVSELIYKPNTVDDLCEAVARYANAKSGKDKPS